MIKRRSFLKGLFGISLVPLIGSSTYKKSHPDVLPHKGKNSFDSGCFYCPYIPLQTVATKDVETLPEVAFKTRYDML